MTQRHVSKAAFAALAVLAAGTAAARADLLVLKQQGTGYKNDQRLPDAAELDVPSGGSVTFRRLPDGTDHVIAGPYKGTFANYQAKPDCAWWDLTCKKGGAQAVDGGARSVAPAPGATRGLAPAAPSDAPKSGK